jgi:hypothetical protein
VVTPRGGIPVRIAPSVPAASVSDAFGTEARIRTETRTLLAIGTTIVVVTRRRSA